MKIPRCGWRYLLVILRIIFYLPNLLATLVLFVRGDHSAIKLLKRIAEFRADDELAEIKYMLVQLCW